MRVAYLAPRVDMRSSSAEVVHVREVVRAWLSMGHDVRVFTSRPGRPQGVPNVGFRDLPLSERPTPFHVPIADLAEAAVLTAVLAESRRFRPEIVYLRHFGSCLPAWFASQMLGARLFVEVNGIHLAERAYLTRRPTLLPFLDSLDGPGFRAAERIIVVSPQIGEHLVASYGVDATRISVVHNGANLQLFQPMVMEDCRLRLGLPSSVPIAVFVGDLARWQGVDILVQSVPAILREIPEAVVVIVGGGAALPELRHLARELGVESHVRFVGPVPYESVATFIGAADIAVAPRRLVASGSSPLKLYEYMACGRPVLASRIPEFRIVAEYGIGRLFEPEDPDALADGAVTLFREARTQREMGIRAREIAKREYSWDSVAARIACLF